VKENSEIFFKLSKEASLGKHKLDFNSQSENHGYKNQQIHWKTFTDSSDPTIEFLEPKTNFSNYENPKSRYFQKKICMYSPRCLASCDIKSFWSKLHKM